jgi:hypothetical protein
MLLECSAEASQVELPHRCPGQDIDAPIVYPVGPGGRTRLADGRTLPVTARCHRCGDRVFVSLVDPAARERKLAEIRPDPTALRAPAANAERVRAFARAPPPPFLRVAADPCPACGQPPDSLGVCRCSE